jgi:hypothetical protein
MTRHDVYQVLALILAAVAIAVPVLDKTGAVNVPIINLQPSGGGGGGGGDGGNGGDGVTPPPPPTTVAVPDVTGLAEQDAKGRLDDVGLSGFRANTTPPQLCSQDSGEVESTLPPAGFEVAEDSQVGLVVCE